MRICVVIPVYNHGLTVERVVREAQEFFPVIVVNDGSTDQTASALARLTGPSVVTLPRNQGKAAALQAGFTQALQQGFTHAITIDADGQHPPDALPDFAKACREQPNALIVGVRDLKAAAAPIARRLPNGLSNFSFKFETGMRLTDTQCGYRVYPLAAIAQLQVKSGRYAYELEILVKAAWAGITLCPQPVRVDYAAPTSRLSHFLPFRDLLEVSRAHSRLCTQAFCIPAPLRKIAARGLLRHLPRGRRWQTVLSHLYLENTESPGRLAGAVGAGLFCGIAPIWGAQMLAAAVLAHKFRLNKAIAVTASNISFPLAAPFILAAGLVLGHFLWTGELFAFEARIAAQKIPQYFYEWFTGSIVLALLVGALGALAVFFVARLWRSRNRGSP